MIIFDINLRGRGVNTPVKTESLRPPPRLKRIFAKLVSSLAQEESRSISENVTWGHRKRFADGKLIMPFSSFLGYERGEDGQPKIVEKEAKIVRMIYKMFLEGKTPTYIAKYLTEQNIPAPYGL